jgi:cysteine desulfurase
MSSIYLDSAATTKIKSEVIEAMMPYFTVKWHNPSSLYSPATKIKKDIENSRKIVGNYINAKSDEIFFTSSGSESNCWAIQGFMNYWRRKGRNVSIITSTIEHKSILNCVDNMNVNVHYVGVDNEGFVNMKTLEALLHDAENEAHKILVSIQFANNEIGTIQHIKEIAEIIHKYDAVFHTDAVQAFGQIPIDVKELDIDVLSASGHKIGTPKGVGILYKKDSVQIDPLIYGSQMDGMRGGTENVPYIIGIAKAIELLQNDKERQLRLTIHRNNFISQLKALGCTVNGSLYERLPNNINVTFFQDINAENLVYLLDMCEIYIGIGSACNSRSVETSHVLRAIGLSDEDAMKTIRITLPDDITMDKIDKAVCNITKQIMLLTME